MSKFKVGDKVRVRKDLIAGDTYGSLTLLVGQMASYRGKEVVITRKTVLGNYDTTSPFFFSEEMLELVKPVKEFIVIRRDKSDVIASHKRGDEIVKTAKATCAPSDEFNFETGAKLAFDRLMGREEPKEKMGDKWWRGENPLPQPAPKFKVGDRVMCDVYGEGTIQTIEFSVAPEVPYGVKCKNGYFHWANERELSPAPEPTYYTGKVFAVETRYQGMPYELLSRNGRVFEIKNGMIMGDLNAFGMTNNQAPFKSFGDFCSTWFSTKWQEVKE